jgi:spore coat polysaccharide biosynthesis protein SpsF
MNVVTIIQARMTSTRLPGKVMKDVGGKPMLEFQVERLRRAREVGRLLAATTTNVADDPIVELCGLMGVTCFRGPEEDVLERYHSAAVLHRADVVVRITSDCPLIDPSVFDTVVGTYLDHRGQYDYVSNILQRSYPRGLDCEAFSFAALDRVHREATAKPEREHVTLRIHSRPEQFRLGNVACEEDHSRHRWTVDTAEDLELIRKIVGALYTENPAFTMWDCLSVLQRHPEWSVINAGVGQRAIER